MKAAATVKVSRTGAIRNQTKSPRKERKSPRVKAILIQMTKNHQNKRINLQFLKRATILPVRNLSQKRKSQELQNLRLPPLPNQNHNPLLHRNLLLTLPPPPLLMRKKHKKINWESNKICSTNKKRKTLSILPKTARFLNPKLLVLVTGMVTGTANSSSVRCSFIKLSKPLNSF